MEFLFKMEEMWNHDLPAVVQQSRLKAPSPDAERAPWKERMSQMMGEIPEKHWGSRLIKLTSDMVLICDENLEIQYHNRAFLRGVGYQSGSFRGHSLLDFIPTKDRGDAESAFAGLMEGPKAGLRINATFLTVMGDRQIDARVTRSRCTNGGMFLYLIAREALAQSVVEPAKADTVPLGSIFDGLATGVFRTDRKLRITHSNGKLWEELGISSQQLVGADLSDPHCHVTPQFLHELDFCDTMAGITIHTVLEWMDKGFEITVEPFVDKSRRVIGTIGIVRRTKQPVSDQGAGHLQFPKAQDYTQALKPTGLQRRSRKIEIGPPVAAAHHGKPCRETEPLVPLESENDGVQEETVVLSDVTTSPNLGSDSVRELMAGLSAHLVDEQTQPTDFGVDDLVTRSAVASNFSADSIPPEKVNEIEVNLSTRPWATEEAADFDHSGRGNDVSEIRSHIRPRRLSSGDLKRKGESVDDPVVLAN